MSETTPTTEPWWVKPALAALAMLIFAGALVASTFTKNETLQVTMFTTAGAAFLTAVGFYFGGAASGARKDETIASIAAKAAPTP